MRFFILNIYIFEYCLLKWFGEFMEWNLFNFYTGILNKVEGVFIIVLKGMENIRMKKCFRRMVILVLNCIIVVFGIIR